MVVGICRLDLHFAGSRSLKDKRRGLRRILDRTRARFNVAAAGVGEQDTWQRGVIGLAVVGGDGGHVQSMVDPIVSFIDGLLVAQILHRDVDLVHYGEGESLSRRPGEVG